MKVEILKFGVVDKQGDMFSEKCAKGIESMFRRCKIMLLRGFGQEIESLIGFLKDISIQKNVVEGTLEFKEKKDQESYLRTQASFVVRPSGKILEAHEEMIGGKLVNVIDKMFLTSVAIIPKEQDVYEKET